MPHWTKDPEKKKQVQQKIKDALAKMDKTSWRKNISASLKGRTVWNTGLPKKQQPRYGKPVSQKQIDNMRKVGQQSHPAWNKGIKEGSPRIRIEEIRQETLKRDNYQCTICQKKKRLIVHHIQHWEEVQDWNLIHSLDNLKTLCRGCHMKLHNEKKTQKFKEVTIK